VVRQRLRGVTPEPQERLAPDPGVGDAPPDLQSVPRGISSQQTFEPSSQHVSAQVGWVQLERMGLSVHAHFVVEHEVI
jgi:hypothetical protein